MTKFRSIPMKCGAKLFQTFKFFVVSFLLNKFHDAEVICHWEISTDFFHFIKFNFSDKSLFLRISVSDKKKKLFDFPHLIQSFARVPQQHWLEFVFRLLNFNFMPLFSFYGSKKMRRKGRKTFSIHCDNLHKRRSFLHIHLLWSFHHFFLVSSLFSKDATKAKQKFI